MPAPDTVSEKMAPEKMFPPLISIQAALTSARNFSTSLASCRA